MHTLITAAAIARRGGDPKQLHRRAEAGEFVRLRPGAYLQPDDDDAAPTPEERHAALIAVTAPLLGPGTVISHWSAAVLLGLPVPMRLLDRVSVIRPGSGSKADSRWVHAVAAPLDPGELVHVHGLAHTGGRRTLRDLAVRLDPMESVPIVDAALRRGFPRDDLDCTPGYALRKREFVRDFADPLAESVLESRSRVLFDRLGLPAPELQLEVVDEHGRFVARNDFTWRRQRVVGEADGRAKYDDQHREGTTIAELVERAHGRDADLLRAGLLPVHWNHRATVEAAELDTAIRDAFRAAAFAEPCRALFRTTRPRRPAPVDWGPLFEQAADQRVLTVT